MPSKAPSNTPSFKSPSKSPSSHGSSALIVKIELDTGNDINMFDVKVFSSGLDVAAGKPSTQSSTLRKFNAELAIDGNPKSFSHTDIMHQANKEGVWWQVELEDELIIDYVLIKNRWCVDSTDSSGCLCRLTNATITLIDAGGLTSASNSVGNTCGKSTVYSDFGNLSACFNNTSSIKIQSTTNEPINLFEVKVISVDKNNISQGGIATQSSTLQGLSKFAASRAIDGNKATFSHTQGGNAWWQLNFNAPYGIGVVEISNRWCRNPTDTPGCLCRLSHAIVSLLDSGGAVVAMESVGDSCHAASLNITFGCAVIA